MSGRAPAGYTRLGIKQMRNRGRPVGSLNVPADLMAVLTPGMLFKPEFVEDGILFRFVEQPTEIEPPGWAKS